MPGAQGTLHKWYQLLYYEVISTNKHRMVSALLEEPLALGIWRRGGVNCKSTTHDSGDHPSQSCVTLGLFCNTGALP